MAENYRLILRCVLSYCALYITYFCLQVYSVQQFCYRSISCKHGYCMYRQVLVILQVRQRLSCKPGFYCCWNILLHPAGNCYTRTRSNVLNCSHCFPFGGLVFGVPALISSGSSTQQSSVRQDRTNKHAELVCHTSHTINPKSYPLSSVACMQLGTNVHSSPAKCYKHCTL